MCLPTCFRNNFSVIFFILTFSQISFTLNSSQLSKDQTEACNITINGELVDISKLMTDDEPLITSNTENLYFYHPCKDVPLNSVVDNDCKKGYGMCHFKPKNHSDKPLDYKQALNNITLGNFTLLMNNWEAVIRTGVKYPEIVYKHHVNVSSHITTYVELKCDEQIEKYSFVIEKTTPEEHVLTLSSKHLCLETPHYMSGGAVFFTILLVFFLLYFVGGILVLKFLRGATGVEMIPNHEFWCGLPQMIKDGFKRLTGQSPNAPDSYEKI